MGKKAIDKITYDNFLSSVPTMVVDTKDRKTISAYGSIDIDDLRSAIDIFKKAPDYGELLKQVQKQKEVIDKINLIIKGVAYGGNEDYYMENFSKINELLKEVSE